MKFTNILSHIFISCDWYIGCFIIAKLFAQLVLRFREKDLAEMIETQGFHNRTVIKKTTEYLDIDYKKTEYDYYPTMFYKRRRKTFMIHVKKMVRVFKTIT